MHIYAFGSICRGEISFDSDVDLLALADDVNWNLDPDKFSIYTYDKIVSLWSLGNPFAWHLATESKMLYASDKQDYLHSLGSPAPYKRTYEDCKKFQEVFLSAQCSLEDSKSSTVFDLSTVFISVRNLAICFALGVLGRPNFSRHAALSLEGEFSLNLSPRTYKVLERARILCSRGVGANIVHQEAQGAIEEFWIISEWMDKIIERVREHERVQRSA